MSTAPSAASSSVQTDYDAILLVAFGGPEKMDDVMPFLENVLRGKNVPRERMIAVSHHYELFDGVSPINQQMRDLLEVLKPALQNAGVTLPVYWGNRNWHPMLQDTLAQMKADGVKKGLSLMVSAYSCYSGCRQYRENILDICETMDADERLKFDKIRVFYNHPLFIKANVERLEAAFSEFSPEERDSVRVIFTAHSLPMSMAQSSDYEKQLTETCRLVAEQMNLSDDRWDLVYQSRSGRPQDPWLEPDILDFLETRHQAGDRHVIIDSIGFLSDHMEVMFDLDVEAKEYCEQQDIKMVRAKTVGTHPDFIDMLVELVQERIDPSRPKQAIGQFGPNHDVCPVNCCLPPRRPTGRPS